MTDATSLGHYRILSSTAHIAYNSVPIEKKQSTSSLIIGAVVGSIIAIGVVFSIYFFLCKKRNSIEFIE